MRIKERKRRWKPKTGCLQVLELNVQYSYLLSFSVMHSQVNTHYFMVQGLPLSANSLFFILTILPPSTSTGLHDDLSPRDFPAPCHFLRKYPSCMLASSSRSPHCFHRLPLYHSAPTRSRFVCLLSLVQGPLPRACLYKISHALTSAPATPPHQRRRARSIVRSRDSDLVVDRLRRILCLYKVSSSHL